jgi:hypothetical protein
MAFVASANTSYMTTLLYAIQTVGQTGLVRAAMRTGPGKSPCIRQ